MHAGSHERQQTDRLDASRQLVAPRRRYPESGSIIIARSMLLASAKHDVIDRAMKHTDRRDFLKSLAAWGLLATTGCQTAPRRPLSGNMRSPVGWSWNPEALKHTLAGHQESHLRTQFTLDSLQRTGIQNLTVPGRVRFARDDEILLAHSGRYLDEVKSWNSSKGIYYRRDRWSPYWSEHAFLAASSAAGATVDLLNDVSTGRLQSGFATVRPPGHHATFDQPMGYCIFNNVAIGIKSLQSQNPRLRVAVVDLDAHHGNGIQDLFYEDPHVLYLSIHQNAWPFSGKIEDAGRGAGLGANINIPLPPRSGDKSYRAITESVLLPALVRFRPDLIVVAMGFDAHWRDPNSFLALSLHGLADICSSVIQAARSHCAGKIAFVLEGGYNPQVLSLGVANTFLLMLGQELVTDPFGISPDPEPDLQHLLAQVRRIHKL